jgi:hypothetical protein
MFPERVADMTPDQKAEWENLKIQKEIKRQYRAAGLLDEWEKKRELSKPLDKDTPKVKKNP